MTSFAAGGFAKGFATGFINERNRRLTEQSSKDEIALRYQLEAFSKKKSDWEEQSKKDQAAIDAAKFVSKQINDDSFAPTALEYLKNGYDQADVIKMYQNGNFKKKPTTTQTVDMPNPDRLANQNNLGVKIPEGVSPTQNAIQDVAQVKAATKDQPILTNDPAIQERYNRTTKQIDEIDPSLRQYESKPRIDAKSVLGDGADYQYVPDITPVKLGSLAEETFAMEDAQRRGDTVTYEKQKQKVDTIKRVEQYKAREKAKAEGKLFTDYALVDKDGKLINYISLEDTENGPVNIAGKDKGNPFLKAPGQELVPVSEEVMKQGWDITEKFSKESTNYNVSTASVAEAVGISRKMIELSKRNPHINTTVSGAVVKIEQLGEEVAAAKDLFQQWQKNALEAKKADDLDGFSAALSNMEEQTKKLETSVLGDGAKQQALDKILFENYKILYAYRLAQANGQSSNSLSNVDLERHLVMVGETAGNQKALQSVLFNQLKQQVSRNDFQRKQLKSKVDMYKGQMPFTLNIEPPRVGDLLQDEGDITFFNEVNNAKELQSIETRQEKLRADTQVQPDEFGMIPGKRYPGAGGKIYEYLGGGKDPKNFKEVQ